MESDTYTAFPTNLKDNAKSIQNDYYQNFQVFESPN